MREAELTYYFQHLEEFPVPQAFSGHTYAYEALLGLKAVMAVLLPKGCGQEILGEVMENATILGDVHIGKGTVVHPGVVIEGPVWIGENCELMAGAYLRPNTLVGNRCVVGHCCELKHSILQNGAKVQSFTFAGDSLVGKSARVGSGAILANRKFNQTNALLKIDGELLDLGTDFFGCVLGDNSRVGANSVTLPGAHIGPYTWIMPGTRVKGFVAERLRVSARQELEITPNEALDLK